MLPKQISLLSFKRKAYFETIFSDKTISFAGFCLKTREVETNQKLFINICTTDAIPPPKDITEEELNEILNTDEITDFKIPMSIGEIRIETDKKGEEAKACDVAINPVFLEKIENIQLFKDFFITVAMQGILNKHGIDSTDEKVLLKNRKAFGNLQVRNFFKENFH